MRTIVNLPREQIAAMDHYGKANRISRAQVVREAVAAYLPPAAHKKGRFENHPAFGSWRGKIDSAAYVRKLRSEWGK
jgi:hypothetical protein